MCDEAVDFIKRHNIKAVELTLNEMNLYMREWFDKIVPKDKQQQALDSYCFNRDGYCGYLWHVFSYEILECLDLDSARKAFNDTLKQDAILLLTVDGVAYRVKDCSCINAEDLNSLSDVILTDCNFKWTYVKTHESACGPYFYSLSKEENNGNHFCHNSNT